MAASLFPRRGSGRSLGKNLDAMIASSFAPLKSEINPVDGGYLVNGTWGFSSGITHSDYIMAQGNIGVDPETGLPREIILMLIPKEDFVVQNTWKTDCSKRNRQ